MSRFPQPPRKLEEQRLLYPAGRPIYKDVDGVNEMDKYYMPDNIEGRKLRPIQTGRTHNYTGVEKNTLPSIYNDSSKSIRAVCLIKQGTGGTTNVTPIYSSLEETSPFKGFGIELKADDHPSFPNQITVSISNTVATDEARGSFNNAVPNDGKYHLVDVKYDGSKDNTGIQCFIDEVELTLSPSFNTLTSDDINRPQAYTGRRGTISGHPVKIASIVVYVEDIQVYSTSCDEQFGLVNYDRTTIGGNDGVIDLGGSSESSFHATDPDVPSRQNEVGHWFSGDAVGVGSYTPIAQDGDGKTDVLGNTAPYNYFGTVRKEALLTNASCMFFDGNLVLTFSDLSGRSIVDQEGDVTLQIVGNDVYPVSGTGVVWYLEFDNGSYYRGSEVNGLTAFDLNTTNALDGTWDLLGSADGTQYGDSEFAEPVNLLNGFTAVTYATGDQHVPADLANSGFDVTGAVLGVKGSSIALNPCESKVVFNPYGAPELHAMGLEDTIELGYAEIIDNESTFHDKREANKVEKLIAYSDFQYPIAGSAAYFDGNITVAVSIAKGDTDFVHQDGIFEITLYASFENGASTTETDVLIGTMNSTGGVTNGFSIFYGNSVVGFEGVIGLRIATGASTYLLTSDLSAILEDGKLHKIKVIGDGDRVIILVDAIERLNTTGVPFGGSTSDFAFKICEDNNYVHRGMIAQIQIVNDLGDEIIFYPSAEEKGLTWFNAGLDKLATSDVTVSLNGSSVGDQFIPDGNLSYHHNLFWGEYDDGTSLIPGDPNNFGFAVDGTPIDNMPEVIKYRRILQFCRNESQVQ